MDLHSLQQQLKMAIQSHQILVSKMKADPQNALLQKQLHELQAEIMALSEKQKQVVQQLRKEIEIKHQSANSVCSHLQHNQEVHSITVQATTLPLMKLEPIPVKTATNTTVVIPATFTLKVPSDHKPVYVTSPLHIPTKHVGEPPSAASPVALNLAPTIRVPQYPPLPQQPPLRPVLLQQNQNRSVSKSPPCPRRPPPVPKASESPKPKLSGADVIKVDFMAALGLITYDTLSELQNRRSERKRRTTANPQFSYGNWEHGEKKRKMNNYLTSPSPPHVRRPRGRPRLGSVTPNSRPTTPDEGSEAGSPNGLSNTVLRNGSLGDHEEVCSVCHNPGSLLNCDTCTLSYHRDCLEPSLAETMPGSWMCPKCQLMKKIPLQWPGSLAMVHSYIAHKAAKEEEKRKLVKRSLELKSEHGQLELKAKQLSDAITIQMQKRSELLCFNKKTQDSIEKLKTFIKFFQVS